MMEDLIIDPSGCFHVLFWFLNGMLMHTTVTIDMQQLPNRLRDHNRCTFRRKKKERLKKEIAQIKPQLVL